MSGARGIRNRRNNSKTPKVTPNERARTRGVQFELRSQGPRAWATIHTHQATPSGESTQSSKTQDKRQGGNTQSAS